MLRRFKLPALALTGALCWSAALAGPVEDLHTLFDAEWERTLEENPTMASGLGDHRYDALWPDRSRAAVHASHRADLAALERLAAIDRSSLPPEEQLNYDLFRRDLENRTARYEFRQYLNPLNHRGGIQTANEITERLRFSTVADYENWIARLNGFGTYADQTLELMREGKEAGIVHPQVILERISGQLAGQVVDDPAQSPFYAPFRSFPDSIPAEEQARLADAGEAAIRATVLPAFVRFRTYFDETYLPAGRDTFGVWDQPRGEEYYAQRAAYFTTTDLTPREIHEIGLSEVARIRAEMETIREQVGFEGDLGAFMDHLRTDPEFYYDTPEELLEAYLAASKRADPELVKLFGRLPRMPYGVRPIPDAIAPDTTTAYYSRPADDGSRAGYYYVNLYRPEVRPKYEIEALTLHEAVPGHHFQIALAMELGELPAFRRLGGITAFVEGWALYAESLGPEMGMYTDPYSKFGQLTYEMWRAVRLVVDTGIHQMRWDRQRAIDYFRANAAKTEADIVNEIDRYIAWPGQALAYKIGELKIKELRARSESALGDGFDIRAFHDTVLGAGAVPLDVLESRINAWIGEQTAAAGR
jgi:uncharacterized protein (DUF885 family)